MGKTVVFNPKDKKALQDYLSSASSEKMLIDHVVYLTQIMSNVKSLSEEMFIAYASMKIDAMIALAYIKAEKECK